MTIWLVIILSNTLMRMWVQNSEIHVCNSLYLSEQDVQNRRRRRKKKEKEEEEEID
jgi:hypothetical protein